MIWVFFIIAALTYPAIVFSTAIMVDRSKFDNDEFNDPKAESLESKLRPARIANNIVYDKEGKLVMVVLNDEPDRFYQMGDNASLN